MSRQSSSNNASASASTPQLPAELPAFLRQSIVDIQAKFQDLEWQQRNRLAASLPTAANPSPSSQWSRLTGDEFACRNRYINVEPWAANRVKLDVAEGVNDYINASPITLGNRRYIATQGPKDTSTSHFYRMLASETAGPAVVVMLTQTHESGREKCYPYFPDSPASPLQLSPDAHEDDGFEGTVTLLEKQEDMKARTTLRKLHLRTRNTPEAEWQEKEVWHCLFGGWPDFSIPEGENRDAMLELISLSAKLNAKEGAPSTSSFRLVEDNTTSGAWAPPAPAEQPEDVDSASQPPPSLNPRIVHCSAGVGRSGTFIALDYLFGQLEAGAMDTVPDSVDLIAETVDTLRQQRMMMVQGDAQFVFLYECLRDAWLERWKQRQQQQAGSSA